MSITTILKYGLPCMPLRGKQPIAEGWRSPEFPLWITEPDYAANYAVVIPDGYFVLDVDPRNMPVGRNTISELMQAIGHKTLNTLQILSGAGGVHIYFKCQPGTYFCGKLKEYPGLDIKAVGGYVVGPGSVHPETKKPYTVRRDPGHIMEVPKALLAIIRKNRVTAITTGSYGFSDVLLDQVRKRIADTPGEKQGGRGDAIYKLFAQCRDAGLSLEMSDSLMVDFGGRCSPPVPPDEVRVIGQHTYEYAQNTAGCNNPVLTYPDLVQSAGVEKEVVQPPVLDPLSYDMTRDGAMTKTIRNLVNLIEEDPATRGKLFWDEMSRSVRYHGIPEWYAIPPQQPSGFWSDSDAINMQYYFGGRYGFDVEAVKWHGAAVVASQKNPVHPLRERLESLRWDGVQRVDDWLTRYCGAKNTEYTRTVGRKWLLGCIHRAYRPGCKFDYMLILEGPQGPGKSQLCQILGLGFASELNMESGIKDTIQGLLGVWIAEMAEMAAYDRKSVAELKRFLTCQSDRLRMPYSRTTEEYKRGCAFIGTINPDQNGYLRDNTGNRRFWPVQISGDLKIGLLSEEVEQLWAEVIQYFKAGEQCYIEDNLLEQMVQEEANTRRTTDAWLEPIQDYLETPALDTKAINDVTIAELYIAALGGQADRLTNTQKDRIASILTDLGWLRDEKPVGKTRRVTYRRPPNE